MKRHRVRADLTRERVGDYALPLGLQPIDLPEPSQGYVLDYVPSEEREPEDADHPLDDSDDSPGESEAPDTYSFQITVSHERLLPILSDAVRLLGDEVIPVVEVGSRDSYRALDVFMSRDPVPLQEFVDGFNEYAAVLLEDANIGIGANSEDPYVEVFLDCWKGLLISVPIGMRRRVEQILARHGLREVAETWPLDMERRTNSPTHVRDVLVVEDEQTPDLEEILMQLRERFSLELNVDPSTNLDDAGRSVGRTLWHVVTIVEHASKPRSGGYLNAWLAADSLMAVEEVLRAHLRDEHPEFEFIGFYSADRVAYDERPDELNDVPARLAEDAVLLAHLDLW